ncbi:uncharacterized protein LOC117171315 [Belonocnema kinseyi]|uniref:uncharacterized protein LOC117171315 n=1 Tax=Belonocnema kinseyi TaxID=2817044 RepID=UPI00143DDE42|nr:uncharacterized protein LOC117171315 [Belonocnema kinseyi]
MSLISQLKLKGAVEECSPSNDQFISSFFLLPKPDGSLKFILNLKDLNEFIQTEHFKLEDYRTAVSLVYQFTCLPFGPCTAPQVFTKLMKPVVSYLRRLGYSSALYLDDFLLFGDTYQDCEVNLKTTKELLESLGFIINLKKSHLNPEQRCKFLGFIYNSKSMTLELPSEKRSHIHKQLEIFSKLLQCRIRVFAQFLGSIVACCPAIKYSWVYTKDLERQRFLALRENGENYDVLMTVRFNPSDLKWWQSSILSGNNSIKGLVFRSAIFSDASKSGWGAVCNNQKDSGFWSMSERKLHINFLELKAAFFGLKSLAKNFRNGEILLRIDNTTAVSYINRMGGVQYKDLNKISKEIWQWCEERNISIFASYISSKDNFEADAESRQLEPETEFERSIPAFNKIVKTSRKPEIDLFASRTNSKCIRYISWKRDPGSEAIDAFTLDWTLESSSALENPYPGGRMVIREAFLRGGAPEKSLEVMTGSLSSSSIKAYDVALKKWWRFSAARSIELFNPPIGDLLAFLTIEFDKGLSHSSRNATRSAISLIVDSEIAKDPRVKRFLKGCPVCDLQDHVMRAPGIER